MQAPVLPNLKPTQQGRSVLNQDLDVAQQTEFKGYVDSLYVVLGGSNEETKQKTWKTLLSVFTFTDEVSVLKRQKGSETYKPSAKDLDEKTKEEYQVWDKWRAGVTAYCGTFRLEYLNKTYTKLDVWQFFVRIQKGIACCRNASVGTTLLSLQNHVHSFLNGMGVKTEPK